MFRRVRLPDVFALWRTQSGYAGDALFQIALACAIIH
jgi:hypothetical protein